MSKLFLSPHNDDAALFAAFTIQKFSPLVLTVYDSEVQVRRGFAACSAKARRLEDACAMSILGVEIAFAGVPDDSENAMCIREALVGYRPSEVWLPAIEEGGHAQHNLVGDVGAQVFEGAIIHRYLTYTRTKGKSVAGTEIKPGPGMVRKKLQALGCYKTQLDIEALGCWPHFMDLREFAATDILKL